jgi:hypothetical protein
MGEALKISRIGPELFHPVSGSPITNVDPQKNRRWAIDDTATEELVSQPFEWPSFAGTPTVAIWGNFAANSGNIGWQVSVEAVTSGDPVNVTSAASFATANASGAVAVPGTAGHSLRVLIPLAQRDNVAAGDRVRLKIAADNSVASKAAGDRYFGFLSLLDVT